MSEELAIERAAKNAAVAEELMKAVETEAEAENTIEAEPEKEAKSVDDVTFEPEPEKAVREPESVTDSGCSGTSSTSFDWPQRPLTSTAVGGEQKFTPPVIDEDLSVIVKRADGKTGQLQLSPEQTRAIGGAATSSFQNLKRRVSFADPPLRSITRDSSKFEEAKRKRYKTKKGSPLPLPEQAETIFRLLREKEFLPQHVEFEGEFNWFCCLTVPNVLVFVDLRMSLDDMEIFVERHRVMLESESEDDPGDDEIDGAGAYVVLIPDGPDIVRTISSGSSITVSDNSTITVSDNSIMSSPLSLTRVTSRLSPRQEMSPSSS